MTWLADGHTEWHHANMDRPWACPLDCGAGEPTDPSDYWTDQEIQDEADLDEHDRYCDPHYCNDPQPCAYPSPYAGNHSEM